MHRILYGSIASLARLAVRSGRSTDIEIIVLRQHSPRPAGSVGIRGSPRCPRLRVGGPIRRESALFRDRAAHTALMVAAAMTLLCAVRRRWPSAHGPMLACDALQRSNHGPGNRAKRSSLAPSPPIPVQLELAAWNLRGSWHPDRPYRNSPGSKAEHGSETIVDGIDERSGQLSLTLHQPGSIDQFQS